MSTQGPSSTSTTSLPDWLSQYAQPFLGAAAQQAQQPYTPYTGPRVADLSPLQQGALGSYGQVAGAAAPLYGQAGQALGGIISGDMNPYTQDVVNRTTRQATDAYAQAVGQTSGRFNSPGNWDSARHDMRDELNQRALATGLGDSIGSLNNNAYNTMRSNQLQGIGTLGSAVGSATGALGSAMQMGDIQRQQMQHVYDTGYNDYMDQRQYPWQQLQNFSGLFTGARGAAPQTTTSQQGYDPVSQGLGVIQLGSALSNKGGQGK
jgi:hypothetical protein